MSEAEVVDSRWITRDGQVTIQQDRLPHVGLLDTSRQLVL